MKIIYTFFNDNLADNNVTKLFEMDRVFFPIFF